MKVRVCSQDANTSKGRLNLVALAFLIGTFSYGIEQGRNRPNKTKGMSSPEIGLHLFPSKCSVSIFLQRCYLRANVTKQILSGDHLQRDMAEVIEQR